MQIGKTSEITYKRSILKRLTSKTEGLLPGVNATSMELGDIMAVMSSNCILHWFLGCEDFYVQKTMNDIYAQGGEPQYLQIEMNIPIDYEEKLLGKITQNFDEAAKNRGLEVCRFRAYASHIKTPIAHITVVGKKKEQMKRKDIAPEMDVVMAGSVGTGGTAVLSINYKQKLLQHFSENFVRDCVEMNNLLNIKSIVRNAIDYGAISMHNISDGGVFGAVWELVSAVNLGITVDISKIPVWQEVIEVSDVLDINPYLLDGTGAVLIVCEDGKQMEEQLAAQGILAAHIGTVTDSKDRIAVNNEETRYLEPPRGNELLNYLEKNFE